MARKKVASVVPVDREAVEHALEILRYYDDAGPRREGWQSDGLRKTVEALRKALDGGGT